MSRRIGVALASMVLVACTAFGYRPVKPEPDGVRIERQLQGMGIATDVASLVQTARSHEDVGVRCRAVELLGRRRDVVAKGSLWKILRRDESRLVRETAAFALIRLGERDALTEAREFLQSEEPARQIFMAGQLAEFGDYVGYPYAAAAAKSKDAYLRFVSTRVLTRFLIEGVPGKAREEIPKLIGELLRDPAAHVRRAALLEVAVARERGFRFESHRSTIERMRREDPDPAIREDARMELLIWSATTSED